MILSLVITALFGVVIADIGLGYQYKIPQTSYGVPAYLSSTNGGYNTGYTDGSSGGGFGYKEQIQSSSFGQQAPSQHTGFQYTGNRPINPSYQAVGGGAQGGYQSLNKFQSSSQYQQSAVQNYQEYYNQAQQQPPQIFKHFYIHAAPEEPEPPRPRQPVVFPPAQKHYKIIFIKTPTQAPAPPQIIPVQQQNEEKTIVYVLVKKPEDFQNVVIPKVEQKPPLKPEVFFIKYNSKEGSQAVINNIVNDYNKGQGSASFSGADVSGGSSSVGSTSEVSGISGYDISSGSPSFSQSAGTAHSDSFSSGSFGSQSYGINDVSTNEQSLSSASVNSGSLISGDFNGSTYTGTSSGTVDSSESIANKDFNAISTSQAVPHETYGPPHFKP